MTTSQLLDDRSDQEGSSQASMPTDFLKVELFLERQSGYFARCSFLMLSIMSRWESSSRSQSPQPLFFVVNCSSHDMWNVRGRPRG